MRMTPPARSAKPTFRIHISKAPIMKQLIITQSFTNRDSAAFERYLSDVEKLPMIDADREAELSSRILSGDRRAIDELVVANLRFGISVAKKYQNLGLPLEDLVAEANAGLIKAAGRFDHTKGFKFISYAVWWVRQSILDALAKKGRVVRVPSNQVATMLKVKSATQHLEQLLERQLLVLCKVAYSSPDPPLRWGTFGRQGITPLIGRFFCRVGRPRQDWTRQVLAAADRVVGERMCEMCYLISLLVQRRDGERKCSRSVGWVAEVQRKCSRSVGWVAGVQRKCSGSAAEVLAEVQRKCSARSVWDG